ncbi:hypothetical protein NS381_08935 [Pantoea stewartii]|nr:hypothetical protein NS381_08935 [Pantoea stewartii]
MNPGFLVVIYHTSSGCLFATLFSRRKIQHTLRLILNVLVAFSNLFCEALKKKATHSRGFHNLIHSRAVHFTVWIRR